MQLYSVPKGQTRWSSFENPEAGKGIAAHENNGAKGHAFDKIPARETVNLLNYNEGAGIINRIWMTLNDRSPYMLRSLVIRCYWDGADKPAVEAPLGDFFSCGSHLCRFENELFSSPEGRSFNMYVPMPFRESARVTITNESDKSISHLYYDVDMVALDEPDCEALYFHCYWNRINKTVLAEDFVILPKVEGCGRFLGTSIVVNANPAYGQLWWGEGEVKGYLDGDTDLPTLCGTGSEDYIGSAWEQGVYINRYQGCLMADRDLRRWIFYRLHIADPVWFKKDFKFTMQVMDGAGVDEIKKLSAANVPIIPVSYDIGGKFHSLYKTDKPLPDEGGINFYRSDDYAAVAWFYLDKKENALPQISPANERVYGLI